MKQLHSGPRRQRGVALIIALILVALATILATKLTFDGFLERQRSTGVLAAEQRLARAETKKEIQVEIAHVFFIEIVGYSKLSINGQRATIAELTRTVRRTEQFQTAEAGVRLDVGEKGAAP